MRGGGQTQMAQKGHSKAEVLSDPYWLFKWLLFRLQSDRVAWISP